MSTDDQSQEAVPPTPEEIAQLSIDNDKAIADLRREGAPIDMAGILNVRLQLLTEALLGGVDDPRRRAYEYRVQTTFAQVIVDLRLQLSRARLLQGVHLPPTNHVKRER